MTDALERLKNRTRPTVHSRDVSLNSASPDISTSRNLDSTIAETEASLSAKPPDISTSRPVTPEISAIPHVSPPAHLDISTSRNLDKKTSRNVDMQPARSVDLTKSKSRKVPQSAAATAAISRLPEPATAENLGAETGLQTKQSTLRLEQGVSDRLQQLCRSQGICREVLIEALFEISETDSALLSVVLAQAQAKNDQRQQMANQRRAQSMMQRFGQS